MQIIPHNRRLRLLVFPFAAYLLIAPVVSFLVALHTASKLNGVPTFIVHGSEFYLNYGLIAVGLAEYLTIVCAFVCTIRLYRRSGEVTKPLPVVAILIFSVTALISCLALVFPQILFAFRRNSDALWTGEWWRLVTPLFVQSAGWSQCVYNGLAALFILPLAEKCYGKRLLALYFVSGLMGEVCFYIFEPSANGGGSSVAIYGVMGGLFIYAIRHRRELPLTTIGFVIAGLCPSVFLWFRYDFHGTGILTGALLACMMRTRLQTISKTPPNNSPEPPPTDAVSPHLRLTDSAARLSFIR
jgi:membrane associated rhomboid family serine protease